MTGAGVDAGEAEARPASAEVRDGPGVEIGAGPGTGPSRRTVLGALGVLAGAGVGFATGLAAGRTGASPAGGGSGPVGGGEAGGGGADGSVPPPAPPATVHAVDATGPTQAGIARPETPQRSGLIAVLGLADAALPTATSWLAALGERILEVTAPGSASDALPDGPGDLSVSVGLGPRVVSARSPDLPGAEDLPLFAGDDEVDEAHRGGDVLLAVYSSDPGVLPAVLRELCAALPGTIRWSQRIFRGPGTGTVVRNPIGFRDGVIVPRGEAELAESVWLSAADGPAETDLTGATICVVRRLRLAADDFEAQPVPDQERVIGRRRHDGAPLTSTGPDDEVDLLAKTPEGQFVTPARSHARAAHPSFTGSGLMLRRGYAYDNGDGDAGLVFICFQRELRTFVATQHRLDEVDDLMAFTTTTASGTFLMLPGFSPQRPLGAALVP